MPWRCTALEDLNDDHATAAAWTTRLGLIGGGCGGLAEGTKLAMTVKARMDSGEKLPATLKQRAEKLALHIAAVGLDLPPHANVVVP